MPTLVQYRQHAARSIGEFFSGNAIGSQSTTTVLVDNTAPMKSSVVSPNYYQDWWLFRPNAALVNDQLRVVATYTPSTGSLTPDLAWTNAPGNQEKYELHGIVEPMSQMTELINETLKRCFATFEVTASPISATATRFNLSSAAPLILPATTMPQWIRQVGFLVAGETRDNINPYSRMIRGWASLDYGTGAKQVFLNHPGITFATTSTYYVLTIGRAYDWCAASGGLYGAQSGLNLDTDIAVPTVEWVTAGVLSEAWQRFGHIMDATSNQRLIRDQAAAAQWFSAQSEINFELPVLTFRKLDWWSPLPVGPGVFSY